MPFVRVKGLQFYYESTDFTRPWQGEAETLVLLHGLHGHLEWWNWFQVAPLSQHYRVVTLDQRGHGRSFKPETGYTIENMANDLYHVLRAIDVDAAHLCGASMGGMVALQLALAHTEMVRSLILVDSYPHTPRVIVDAIQRWIVETEARGYAEVMRTFNRDYAEALFSPRFWQEHGEFPDFEGRLVLDNLMPDAAFIGACRAIQSFDVSSRLHEITQPVLVITSDAGMAYDEGLRLQSALPHAQLWAPPGVGHSPHVEIPEEFNAHVLDFLRFTRAGPS